MKILLQKPELKRYKIGGHGYSPLITYKKENKKVRKRVQVSRQAIRKISISL